MSTIPRKQLTDAIREIENPEAYPKNLAIYTDFIKEFINKEDDEQSPVVLQKGQAEILLLTLIVNSLAKNEQNKEIEDLKKRVTHLEKVSAPAPHSNILDEQEMDIIIDSSPALKKMCAGRELSLPSKRLLIKNLQKIERLYAKGKIKINVQKYTGSLELKNKEIADEILE